MSSASVRITVDLGALAANYAQLRRRAHPAEVAAVVKADAYGLGIEPVARRLAAAGCRAFFVATVAEGLALRAILAEARIFVLNELPAAALPLYRQHALLPVLNTLDEAERWAAQAPGAAAALQLDTGMTRAGLSADELPALRERAALRASLNLTLLISQLACADEPQHPMNRGQLERFTELRQQWPGVAWSLANSAGIFLGPQFHGDVVRPGIALYGGRPGAANENPMQEVVRLEGRILQLRTIRHAVRVGYGATGQCAPPARIATVGIGYADGYLRALGNRGQASCGGQLVPVIGRVSMDLLNLDVSAIPEPDVAVGDYVTLIGGAIQLEQLAELAGTVNYELLTSLSRRAERVYR